jgi:cell division protease FtsH
LSQGRDYSEATAARIDQEVEKLLSDRQLIVRRLLTEARDRLDRLATTLLKEETVAEEQLAAILGPRPTLQKSPAEELATA